MYKARKQKYSSIWAHSMIDRLLEEQKGEVKDAGAHRGQRREMGSRSNRITKYDTVYRVIINPHKQGQGTILS
jgi:hypothetical protein